MTLRTPLLHHMIRCFLIVLTIAAGENSYGVLCDENRRHLPAQFPLSEGCEYGAPILVPVTCNGETSSFLVDTGASHTICDVSLLPDSSEPLKEILVGDGVTGKSKTFEVHSFPEAAVGKIRVCDVTQMIAHDFTWLRQMVGEEVYGVIGMDFLRNFVVQLDFDGGSLAFLDPVSFSPTDLGSVIPLTYDRMGCPEVAARLKGKEVLMNIDTGATSVSFSGDMFDGIVREDNINTADTLFGSIFGVTVSKVGRFDGLTVGPNQYDCLLINTAKESHLGLAFLSRHMVTLDFPNQRTFLKEGRRFHERDEASMAGISILKVDNQFVVQSVDKGGPADNAGVESNDIIAEILGYPSDSYSLWQAVRVFRSGHGKDVPVTIDRGGIKRQSTIKLKRKL